MEANSIGRVGEVSGLSGEAAIVGAPRGTQRCFCVFRRCWNHCPGPGGNYLLYGKSSPASGEACGQLCVRVERKHDMTGGRWWCRRGIAMQHGLGLPGVL